MSVTVQQILCDAKKLVTRLKDHDNSADTLITQAQTLNKNLEAAKEYNEEIAEMSASRPSLILTIQQESRHIRELQQENRELQATLMDYQSSIELIMSKYRQQVAKLLETNNNEKLSVVKVIQQESVKLQSMVERINESNQIMQEAINIDDKHYAKYNQVLTRLKLENDVLRQLLFVSQVKTKEDKDIQTDDI